MFKAFFQQKLSRRGILSAFGKVSALFAVGLPASANSSGKDNIVIYDDMDIAIAKALGEHVPKIAPKDIFDEEVVRLMRKSRFYSWAPENGWKGYRRTFFGRVGYVYVEADWDEIASAVGSKRTEILASQSILAAVRNKAA